jgi:hypothetical protein
MVEEFDVTGLTFWPKLRLVVGVHQENPIEDNLCSGCGNKLPSHQKGRVCTSCIKMLFELTQFRTRAKKNFHICNDEKFKKIVDERLGKGVGFKPGENIAGRPKCLNKKDNCVDRIQDGPNKGLCGYNRPTQVVQNNGECSRYYPKYYKGD